MSVRLSIIGACSLLFVFLWNERPVSHPTLILCDVGQGDAILLIDGSWQMLVDAGPDSSVLSCLGKHLPFWDRQIELVVATHPDSDHIDGLQEVLARFTTPVLMMEWLDKETTEFEALKRSISSKAQSKQLQLLTPAPGMELQTPSKFVITVLWPDQAQRPPPGDFQAKTETQLWDKNQEKRTKTSSEIKYNDRSIVLLLHLMATRVLLTGDLESAGEQALLKQSLTEPVDILKVGHHGSKTSTSQSFLDTFKPETSLISVGKNNRYGHPSPEVLERLSAAHTRVYSTAESGDIVITFFKDHYAVTDKQQASSSLNSHELIGMLSMSQ